MKNSIEEEMTEKEFVDILKMAKEYYSPYTRDSSHESYMCYAIGKLYHQNKISKSSHDFAKATILDLIYPHTTLESYIAERVAYSFAPSDKDLVAFWDSYINVVEKEESDEE